MIRDLMMLMPEPGPAAGQALHDSWLERFADLDQLDADGRHTMAAHEAEKELTQAVNRSRMAVLEVLHSLD
jgi:hypothetical protein